MGAGTAGIKTDVTARAVVTGAPPPVVIPADLPGVGLDVLRASRIDPRFLGWPCRGKKRAFRGRVRGVEAVVTPGFRSRLSSTCEGFRVELGIYLTPRS